MEGQDAHQLNGPSENPKILIVGAGIAGIAAGNHLAKEGFTNFKIFETSDRIGGRIWSVLMDKEGNMAEMGANWIHGVENNPIFQIADENHLLQLRHEDKTLRKKDLFMREEGEIVGERLVKEVDLEYGRILAMCEDFHSFNQPIPEDTDSVGQFLDKKFQELLSTRSAQNGDHHLRELIFSQRKLLECCISGCDNLNEVNLQDFGSYENLPGVHYTIPPGFSTILEILSREIPKGNIVFNAPVRCINWDMGPASKYPVCVELENGELHYANHVIVTVSLGVLKATCDHMFRPSLPAEKLAAISAIGFGVVDKVFLEFEHPVVEPDVFRLSILWDDKISQEEDIQNSWFRKIYSFEVVHERILVGWLSGKQAIFMESLTDQQVSDDCVAVLKRVLRRDIPHPIRIIRTKWGTNPLTYGSYSFVKVGSSQRDIEELGQPLRSKNQTKPSLLFAGEATHPNFYSTTHGALLTGFREAKRLLKMYNPEEGESYSENESTDDDDGGLSMAI